MKLTRGLMSFLLVFSLGFVSFLALPARQAIAQESNTALQRGYRTGYSDGYMAGYRDVIDKMAKDPSTHADYTSASRGYNSDYGTLEDYQDGYKQGFEKGYTGGFDKQSFDSAIPTDLTRRGQTPATVTPMSETSNPVTESSAASTPQNTFTGNDIILIPKDTELILELQDELSTNTNREGDKFTAKIVSPAEISGATVEGRIRKVQRPGRIKRRSELAMSFDRIVLNETRWSNFSASLTEVLPVKGDNVKRVDDEGSAVGRSSYKGDAVKIGAATGSGAVIGAAAGGPVGSAIGAGIGAAFGVGAVVIDRGKDIRLNRNQQLRVKSSYETQIR